jgi:hypothetical protein
VACMRLPPEGRERISMQATIAEAPTGPVPVYLRTAARSSFTKLPTRRLSPSVHFEAISSRRSARRRARPARAQPIARKKASSRLMPSRAVASGFRKSMSTFQTRTAHCANRATSRLSGVLHPGGEDHRESGAVRDVVDAADLVLDVVRGPVPDAPGVEQVVVGDRARPHELGPGVVVPRIRPARAGP